MFQIIQAMALIAVFLFPGNGIQLKPTSTVPLIGLTYPLPGQALQGKVSIEALLPAADFQSAELTFSYMDDSTDTWFLISTIDEFVEEGELAIWDTSTISDGTYQIRLTVYFIDGEEETGTVTGLRVRNYTPIETDTPTPVTVTKTPETVQTPAPTDTAEVAEVTALPKTATPMPANEASVSRMDVINSLGVGAAAAFVIFVIIGVYLYSRSLQRRN